MRASNLYRAKALLAISLTDTDWVDVHATVTCSGGIRIDLPIIIYEPQPQQWVAPV